MRSISSFFSLLKAFWKFSTAFNFMKVKFHLVKTSTKTSPFCAICSFLIIILNFPSLKIENLTYFTAFLIIEMEVCTSFSFSLTTKLSMCAQYFMCISFPSITRPFQIFTLFLKYVIALSIVIIKILFNLYSFKHDSICFPIISSLWFGI